MKRLLLSLAMSCALAGVVVMAADKPAEKKPEIPATKPTTKPSTQPAAPINKFCAVETENPVDPTVPTVTYKGKVIGFCCEDCAPKFLKDPEFYMKTLK